MLLLLFLGVWAIAAFIFYLRYPQNFIYPNFFAEDGQHFVQNIIDKGVLQGTLTFFNGYLITGIYLLTAIGFGVNELFFHGEFVNLPAALAVTSYAFLGLCAALPVILLRGYMKLPYRLGAALLIALLPFPNFDYVTFGTIGNLKFAFVYIAALLVMYRMRLPRSSLHIPFIDAGLVLCAYTTAGTYFVLPFLLLCDGLRPMQLLQKKQWRKTFRLNNVALWSAVALGLVVAAQVALIALRGLPENPGYLEEPYEASKTIEIFVARTYLYPIIAVVYQHMNDILIALLFAASALAMWRYGSKEHRWIYVLGMSLIFASTAIFVANRTGVSVHYNDYTSVGFDNFFYAQNFIFIILILLLLADLSRQFSWFQRWRLALVVVALLALGSFITNRSYAPNDFMHFQIGTITQQAAKACANKDAETITFMVYPFTFLTMEEPRNVICTPSAAKQSPLQDFGLHPTENMPLNIGPGNPAFQQTFVANQNNLNGLVFYLSTYYQNTLKGYHLFIKDASCKQTLRTVPMPTKVRDNTYSTVRFESIANSRGKAFCFTVTSDNNDAPQLALQLSAEYAYDEGKLTILDIPLSRDVVFEALYKR